MKTFKEIMNEASVGKSVLPAASRKVVDYLSRSLGVQFLEVSGQEYSNSSGSYFGYLFVSNEGPAIRVNWDGQDFHSINYWDDYVTEINPTLEIFVKNLGPADRSFVKVLPEISSILTGNENDEENTLTEAIDYRGQRVPNNAALARVMYDAGEDMDAIKQATGYPPGHIRKLIAKYNGTDPETNDAAANKNTGSGKVKVVGGAAETIIPSKNTKAAEKILEETEYADPDLVYKDLDDYLKMVMVGYETALLITGQGGIGKSYNVNQALKQFNKERNKDYIIMKGSSSVAEMYDMLWRDYDKIIIFDDCDSVFDSSDGLNLLKGALDSGKEREISYVKDKAELIDTVHCGNNFEVFKKMALFYANAIKKDEDDTEKEDEIYSIEEGKHGEGIEKLKDIIIDLLSSNSKLKRVTPNHFFFEGQVIFISNRTRAQIAKADRALPTRCTCIDIVLRAEDVIKRIETCLPHIKIYKAISKNDEADITDENLKREVYEWISSEEFLKDPRRRGKEMNFRTFIKIYNFRHAGLERWKELSFRAG